MYFLLSLSLAGFIHSFFHSTTCIVFVVRTGYQVGTGDPGKKSLTSGELSQINRLLQDGIISSSVKVNTGCSGKSEGHILQFDWKASWRRWHLKDLKNKDFLYPSSHSWQSTPSVKRLIIDHIKSGHLFHTCFFSCLLVDKHRYSLEQLGD